MLTKFLVLYAGLAVSVVTANPLLQAVVAQTCPICEQNSLKSQLQNLLLQSLQPYPQAYFNPSPVQPVQPGLPVEQPCSLCPTQNRPNQNLQPSQNRQNQNFQIPPCQQASNQPYCPRSQPTQPQNNNVVPGAVNKILSNPNLRNILDPNTKFFNQNGVEIPRNGVCGNGTPNVVNNYFIVPPDFLLDVNSNNPKSNKNNPSERREKHKTNNSNIRAEETKEVNSQVAPENARVIENTPDNGKRKQRRKQRNKHPDIKVKVLQDNKTQEINQIESPQPMEQINVQNKQDKLLPSENTNNHTNSTTTAKDTGKIDEEKEIKNVESKSSENIPATNKNINPLQNQVKNSPVEKQNLQQEDTQLKNVKANAHKNVAKTKPKKSSTRHFNTREEAVLKDFRRKFPNIPEDVVKKLIEHMRRQFQQQNFNAPTFYYPQFPISYDQLFSNQFSQTPTIVVSSQGKKHNSSSKRPVAEDDNLTNNDTSRRRRRKNRRYKTQQAPEKSTTPEIYPIVESTPGTVLATSDKSSTSTTTNPTTTTTEVLLSSKVATQNDKTESTSLKVIETSKPLESIEAENIIDAKVPTKNIKEPKHFINELADEYYPDFTGDHQYYSNEDFSFVILEDDRFHYTTDKNVALEEHNRERRRFDSNSIKNARRPEGRYILKLKNKDKSKLITRQNIQDKGINSKDSESSSGIHTEIPKIVVKIKSKDTMKPTADEDADFVEWNINKPTTLSDEHKIQFRTPPTLEKIDFETKQVNKKHYSSDDYETKTSSYSDFKTPQYNFNKHDEIYRNVDNFDRPKPQIETVYANSKVATYGKPASVEVSTEKDIWMDIDNEYSRIENDGRKVVFAKSIDGDFW